MVLNLKCTFPFTDVLYKQNKWLVDKDHPSAKIESEKRIKNQKYNIFEDTEEFIKKEDYLNRYKLIQQQ